MLVTIWWNTQLLRFRLDLSILHDLADNRLSDFSLKILTAVHNREHLWRRLQAEGITKNSDTWVVKHHIAEIYGTPTYVRAVCTMPLDHVRHGRCDA